MDTINEYSIFYNAYTCAYCKICPTPDLPLNQILAMYKSLVSKDQNMSIKYIDNYVIPLNRNHFILIFCLRPRQVLHYQNYITNMLMDISKVLSRNYKLSMLAAVGNICKNPYEISNTLEEARHSLKQATPENPLYFYDQNASDCWHNDLLKIKTMISQALETCDSNLLKTALEALLSYLEASPDNYNEVSDLLGNLLYLSLSLIPDGKKAIQSLSGNTQNDYVLLNHINSREELISWLHVLYEDLCTIFDNIKNDDKKNPIFKIQLYIQEHLDQKLTLQDVAKVFGLSPNYLSSLFKKNCNLGFTEYVRYTKMQYAKKLLAENQLKIYEVSAKLGYDDPFYFSKVFKQVMGYPPKDFIQHQNQ